MKCTITSQQKTEHFENVGSVSLPAFRGQAQILPKHAEAFMILGRGDIVLKQSNGKEKIFNVSGGDCYINKDAITIIYQ